MVLSDFIKAWEKKGHPLLLRYFKEHGDYTALKSLTLSGRGHKMAYAEAVFTALSSILSETAGNNQMFVFKLTGNRKFKIHPKIVSEHSTCAVHVALFMLITTLISDAMPAEEQEALIKILYKRKPLLKLRCKLSLIFYS